MGSCSSHPDPNDLNNLENCRGYKKSNYVSYAPNPVRAEAYKAAERKARAKKARSGGKVKLR